MIPVPRSIQLGFKMIPGFLAVAVGTLAYQASRYGWQAAAIMMLFGVAFLLATGLATIRVCMTIYTKNLKEGLDELTRHGIDMTKWFPEYRPSDNDHHKE